MTTHFIRVIADAVALITLLMAQPVICDKMMETVALGEYTLHK